MLNVRRIVQTCKYGRCHELLLMFYRTLVIIIEVEVLIVGVVALTEVEGASLHLLVALGATVTVGASFNL